MCLLSFWGREDRRKGLGEVLTTSHEELCDGLLECFYSGKVSGVFFVANWSLTAVAMDIADQVFVTNLDWDPQYLMECVTQDFYDFKDHWQNSISDTELISGEVPSRYTPMVEDISLVNDTL